MVTLHWKQIPIFDCRMFIFELSKFSGKWLTPDGIRPTTSRLYAECTYVYKYMHRYICVGFGDIIFKCFPIYAGIWTNMQETLKSKDLTREYICQQQTPTWKGSVDFSHFPIFGIQHTSKPLPNLVVFAGSPNTFCHISATPSTVVLLKFRNG